MKKLLYFLPVILGCILYIFLGLASSFDSIAPFAWIALGLLLISGLLMDRKNWWGGFLGILIGILLIYMGSRETGQIIKETPLGITICIYYSVCALVSCKNLLKRGKNEKEII